MRTAAEIMKEIKEIEKKDRKLNYIINEGGEGYEHDSVPAALRQEYEEAEQREFAELWTLDYTRAIRKKMNNLSAEREIKSQGELIDLFEDYNISLWDLRRAIAMHAIEREDWKQY